MTRAVLRRWTHCAHWTHWTRASPGSRRLAPKFVFGSSGHDVSQLSILEDQVLLNGEVQQQQGGG